MALVVVCDRCGGQDPVKPAQLRLPGGGWSADLCDGCRDKLAAPWSEFAKPVERVGSEEYWLTGRRSRQDAGLRGMKRMKQKYFEENHEEA